MHKQLDLLSKGSLHEKPDVNKAIQNAQNTTKKAMETNRTKKELSLNCKHRTQWYHEGGLVQES